MKKFARVQNGKVVKVVNAVDEDNLNQVHHLYNHANSGKWVEYTTSTKNRPGVGFGYIKSTGVFSFPQSYPSWSLNETTGKWEPPVTYPSDGKVHDWDETDKSWKLALCES